MNSDFIKKIENAMEQINKKILEKESELEALLQKREKIVSSIENLLGGEGIAVEEVFGTTKPKDNNPVMGKSLSALAREITAELLKKQPKISVKEVAKKVAEIHQGDPRKLYNAINASFYHNHDLKRVPGKNAVYKLKSKK